jgi:hypothetical protein
MIRASKRAIRRTHPERSERDVGHLFIELHYGPEVANAIRPYERRLGSMANSSELAQALRPVVDELDRLGVRYYVGGSVASSMHGAGRSTLDVDVVAELDQPTALSLIDALRSEYYVSEASAREAVRCRSCFNLIHLATSFKVDVFVSQGREFDRSVLDRAVQDTIGETEALSARIATAEDIILLKLEWYRLGNESSERQWSDLTSVGRLQENQLDQEYLRRWAGELGVADLLERLLSAIGR